MFYTRTKMLPFAGNYSHDNRFLLTNWMCKCERSKESESHLLSGNCIIYGDINVKYTDLKEDIQLVKFFSEVLERRDKLNENKLFSDSDPDLL